MRGRYEAAGEALRPGRAAQPGPGDAHDRPRDRDPGLRDHGGDRQAAHDGGRDGDEAVEERGSGHAPIVRSGVRDQRRRTVRTASAVPAAVQARRTSTGPAPGAGTRGQHRPQPLGQRPRGQQRGRRGDRPGQPVQGDDDPACQQQHEPHGVRDRQHDVGPQRAPEQQAQRPEGGAAEQHQQQRPAQARGGRSPAEHRGERGEHHDLHGDGREHRRQPARHEQPARQRRRREPPDHPVAPVEAQRDGLAGERRRHHREREHRRRDGGDAGFGQRDDVEHGEPDQQQHGDDEREQHLLAVAQRQPQLGGRLRGEHRVRARRRRVAG